MIRPLQATTGLTPTATGIKQPSESRRYRALTKDLRERRPSVYDADTEPLHVSSARWSNNQASVTQATKPTVRTEQPLVLLIEIQVIQSTILECVFPQWGAS